MSQLVRGWLAAVRLAGLSAALPGALTAAALPGALLAEALIVSGAPQAHAGAPFWTEAPAGPAGDRPDSFAALADTLVPAVVNIRVTRELEIAGHTPHEVPATASGFVVTADGYIVTNNHVVDEAGSLLVSFLDGLELPAHVIGRDADTDLALIKVDTERKLPVAPLGDSAASRVGDWVVAIGNPLGLEHSVTVGILSAKGRRVNGLYDDYLQTDASINPGNSGGPLIDTRGRVVGINTMIRVYDQAATGIAFAIPINLAKPLLRQLHARGRVTRGYLGIQFQPLTDALARGFHLESTAGALVGDVFPGSPAERAALHSGDVIVEFNGERVSSAQDLPRCVAAVMPGSEIDMVVVRSGKQRTLHATLTPKPDKETVAQVTPARAPKPETPAGWGFEVGKGEKPVSKRVDVSDGPTPLVVTKVQPDSPAFRAGLREEDVILEVNGSAVRSEQELMHSLEQERLPVLRTKRGESTFYRALERN